MLQNPNILETNDSNTIGCNLKRENLGEYEISTEDNSPYLIKFKFSDSNIISSGNFDDFDSQRLDFNEKKPKILFNSKVELKKYVKEYKKKIKTELCNNFQLTGKCKFKGNCAFAHGEVELKEKCNLTNNYKTKPCGSFFNKGICKYGKRCQYIHNEILYHSSLKQFYIEYLNENKFPEVKIMNAKLFKSYNEELNSILKSGSFKSRIETKLREKSL